MEFKNFKDLADYEIAKNGELPKQVKHNVEKNINLFSFMGDIVDTYLPKIISIFVGVSGGDMSKAEEKINNKKKSEKYRNQL